LTTSLTLVESIRSLYGSRGNYSSQGSFDEESRTNTFPSQFGTFVDSSGDDDCFFQLSLDAMAQLVEKSSTQNFATGGYVLFAHYISRGQNFFIVAMVKKKDGITLTNLKPKNIQEVDLSKLHQAIRINITGYLQALAEIKNNQPNKISYLSFISPSSNQGASGYFIKAFGCSDAIATFKATNAALDAVNAYFGQDNKISHLKALANDRVISLFEDLLEREDDNERICTLELLNESVRSVIISNDVESIPDDFMEFANGENFSVPNSFYPSKTAVSKAKRVRLKSESNTWSLNFEKRVFGDTPNADIQYQRGDGDDASILIRNLPKKIKEQLEKVIKERPSNATSR
jgi:nucleoid-associated protein